MLTPCTEQITPDYEQWPVLRNRSPAQQQPQRLRGITLCWEALGVRIPCNQSPTAPGSGCIPLTPAAQERVSLYPEATGYESSDTPK